MTTAALTGLGIYSRECDVLGVHPNSGVLRLLSTQDAGDAEDVSYNNSSVSGRSSSRRGRAGTYRPRELDLGNNFLGSRGVMAFIPVLSHPRYSATLRTLVLRKNRLDNTAVSTLATLLATGFPMLQLVDLSYNPFTFQAAKKLAWMCEGVVHIAMPERRCPAAASATKSKDRGKSYSNTTASEAIVIPIFAEVSSAAALTLLSPSAADTLVTRQRTEDTSGGYGNDNTASQEPEEEDELVGCWVGQDNIIREVLIQGSLLSPALLLSVQGRIAAAILRRENRKIRVQEREGERRRVAQQRQDAELLAALTEAQEARSRAEEDERERAAREREAAAAARRERKGGLLLELSSSVEDVVEKDGSAFAAARNERDEVPSGGNYAPDFLSSVDEEPDEVRALNEREEASHTTSPGDMDRSTALYVEEALSRGVPVMPSKTVVYVAKDGAHASSQVLPSAEDNPAYGGGVGDPRGEDADGHAEDIYGPLDVGTMRDKGESVSSIAPAESTAPWLDSITTEHEPAVVLGTEPPTLVNSPLTSSALALSDTGSGIVTLMSSHPEAATAASVSDVRVGSKASIAVHTRTRNATEEEASSKVIDATAALLSESHARAEDPGAVPTPVSGSRSTRHVHIIDEPVMASEASVKQLKPCGDDAQVVGVLVSTRGSTSNINGGGKNHHSPSPAFSSASLSPLSRDKMASEDAPAWLTPDEGANDVVNKDGIIGSSHQGDDGFVVGSSSSSSSSDGSGNMSLSPVAAAAATTPLDVTGDGGSSSSPLAVGGRVKTDISALSGNTCDSWLSGPKLDVTNATNESIETVIVDNWESSAEEDNKVMEVPPLATDASPNLSVLVSSGRPLPAQLRGHAAMAEPDVALWLDEF